MDHLLKGLDNATALQGRGVFIFGNLSQFSHGSVAGRHVFAMQEQLQPLLPAFFPLKFFDPGLFHVKIEHFGRAGQAKSKMVVALWLQPNHFLFAVDFNLHFALKKVYLCVGGRGVFLLNLFDVQVILLGFGIKRTAQFKNRVPGLVNPLLKKPLQVFSAGFFYGILKILGCGQCESFFFDKNLNRFKKGFVA